MQKAETIKKIGYWMTSKGCVLAHHMKNHAIADWFGAERRKEGRKSANRERRLAPKWKWLAPEKGFRLEVRGIFPDFLY